MFGILKKGTAQLGEIVSSQEAQVLVAKVKAGLPNLGARVSELIRELILPIGQEEAQ